MPVSNLRRNVPNGSSFAGRLTRGAGGSLKAAATLALVLVLVYGEIVFFGYTLNPGLWNYGVLNVPQYGYIGRWPSSPYVMDPLATGGQNWPIYALFSKTLVSGVVPLWNPYQGAGAPLAANTVWTAYFPIDILYAMNNQYWDFGWILRLWVAGMLCYLFLRRLDLGWLSAVGGGLAYSLSGAFIFYPFLPWTNVAIMTPALLLVAKRCFDQPFSRQAVVLGSVVFAISLLGAHIEALVIQFLYVILFVLFLAITRKKESIRGITTWGASVLLGMGLGAFFLFPVLEYLLEATLGHGAGAGLASLSTEGNPAIWWMTLFVPYFFGFLQTYPYDGLRQVFFWDISPGYLGATVLFLSLLPLFSIRELFKRERTKYYVFFFVSEILILMKVFGVPLVNWVGLLPVLNYVIFPRFCGSVLAMSFAGACAYGLEMVATSAKRNSVTPLVIILVTLGLAAYATIPFPASPNNSFFVVSLAYLTLSILFLIFSASVSSKGRPMAAAILVAFIVLELTSYVPKSLPERYEEIRFATLAAAATVIFVGFGTGRSWRLLAEVRASLSRSLSFARIPRREHLLAMVVIAALVLQFTVSAVSPQGLPNRYDAFTEAPYVRFLQTNIGYQRVYSLDGVFFPPVAGLFSIQSLGSFSAFMPSSFGSFMHANLDRGAISTNLVGNAWNRVETVSPSQEIHDNIAFYSLLGVKYFVTAYTDLNLVEETLLQPETDGSHGWAPLGNNSVSTQFITDLPFDGLLVRIGTYDRTNSGDVVLTLDTVPGNVTYHRESRVNAQRIANGAFNLFPFEKIEVNSPTRFRITLSQSEMQPGNEVAVMWWPQVRPSSHLTISPGSLNVALGVVEHDQSLPIVYRDQNATIYQNLMAFPRAFLVSHVVIVRNEEEAVLTTRSLGWDTRETLVLEEAPSSAQPIPMSALRRAMTPAGAAEIEQYSPSEVAIRVETPDSSFLVLTDTFYPGWRAYFDGKAGAIYRAYGVARAVFVTAGSHKVVFRYEPDSFRMGGAITLASVSLVAVLYAIKLRALKDLVRRPRDRNYVF